MTDDQRNIHELSLMKLLQAVQRKMMAEPLPPDQHWLFLHMTANILQACAQGGMQPLPARDMQEIRRQNHVKRALEVAAAGGHNIRLVGPPGAGKTVLAQVFPSLLPQTPVPYPFRMPDSTMERAALLGEMPFPGELTLAHGGVLFLKELSAFDRSLLAAVQQAVATHMVAVSEVVVYPAHFLLIATMKPCPCGFYGDPIHECTCSAEEILAYSLSLQEVVTACFDLHVEVPIPRDDVMKEPQDERSLAIRQRVEAARERQRKRYAHLPHLWVNADIHTVDEAQQYCEVDALGEKLLRAAHQQLHFTPFYSLQIRRVARTIADLAGSEVIAANHIAEAISYRPRPGR